MQPKCDQYILCKYVPLHTGKTDKIPVSVSNLRATNAQDRANHTSLAAAAAAATANGPEFGTGFVLTAQDDYFFIDLDNCLDPATNQWTATAQHIMSLTPHAYKEISQSGKGIHIIGRYSGPAPVTGRRLDALGVEIYTQGRFCAMTGTNAVGDAEIDQTQGLHDVLAYLGISAAEPEPVDRGWITEYAPNTNVPEDNDDVIRVMLSAAPTARETFGGVVSIKELWNNDVEALAAAYPSNTPGKAYDYSQADAALAYRLSYYVGGNCDRVLELMNMSGLSREKWTNSGDYLTRTISSARAVQSDFYAHARVPIARTDDSIKNVRLVQAFHYPQLSNSGKVLDTSENLLFLLDSFGITVRWNDMKRDREIDIPKCTLFPDDAENYALSFLKDLALVNEMPIVRIDEHLSFIAQNNSYHPIVEGLKANPWDGVSRMQQFIDTLETTNPELTAMLIRRWMIAAVGAAHSTTGFASPGVLVLAGAQNLGKTRFIQALDPFNCSAVKTGAMLDPKDKDCVRTLASYWIAELGELDGTLRKTDIARLKAFITDPMDRIRLPYARKDSLLARRTIFAATVNDEQFLTDDTGNRRWWTIHVLKIHSHSIDMVQLWAEAYALWAAGEQTWMTDEEHEALSIGNREHEQLDHVEESLLSFFDFSEGWENKELLPFSATDVLRHMGLPASRSNCTRMGKIITKYTGLRPRRGMLASVHFLRAKV